MKKIINVVGVGRRMAGTARNSGNPYDFTPVSFTFEDSEFRGLRCATVNIDKETLGEYTPSVGDSVEVVMHEDFRTRRLYVDAVL